MILNLNDVVDFRLDEVQQGGDATLGGLLHFDGATADGSNGLPDEVNVHLGGVPEQSVKLLSTYLNLFRLVLTLRRHKLAK